MNIDLNPLHNNRVSEIDISNTYSIPKEYIYEKSVLEANNIVVNGKIYLKELDENDYLDDYLECTIKGKIKIEDSISFEPIELDIDIEYDDFIDENYKKDENTLDILQLLWENIVLEVPLRFTKVQDLSKYQGDGWRVVREDERINPNNPFLELLNDFEEE